VLLLALCLCFAVRGDDVSAASDTEPSGTDDISTWDNTYSATNDITDEVTITFDETIETSDETVTSEGITEDVEETNNSEPGM
jgi:hypothetical protein